MIISKHGSNAKESQLIENRLLFDFGFYQDNIMPGLDFALVFYNFGFYWKKEKPYLSTIQYKNDKFEN